MYAIVVAISALMLSIIDLGNIGLSPDEKVRATLAAKTYPDIEYKYLDKLLAHILTVVRISIGDFQFDAATSLNMFQNIAFWIVWFLVVIVTCIIFLNFIIAEVSASY